MSAQMFYMILQFMGPDDPKRQQLIDKMIDRTYFGAISADTYWTGGSWYKCRDESWSGEHSRGCKKCEELRTTEHEHCMLAGTGNTAVCR